MVSCELKKLLGNRFLLIALALLLVLNCAVAYFSISERHEPAISDAQKDFLGYYLAHTEEVEAHAAEIEAFEAEQRQLEMEALSLGIDFERQKYPDIYNIDRLTDARLISWARSTVNSAGSYTADLTAVIERAQNNLAQLESDGYGDSYSANYQRKVIEEYQTMLDSGRMIGIESDHGWGDFYSYTAGDLLLFAFIIMLASALFLQEKQCGFWQIIRTARHGRLATGAAKLSAFVIASAVALLLFAGSSFAVFGAVCGYSSPDNVLQVLDTFRFSTLQITVGQYLPLCLLLKWSALLVFGLTAVLLSLFFTHTSEAYAVGVLFFGVQYLMQAFPYLDADHPFRNLNLLTVAEGVRLTSRYRTLNIFGNAVPAMLCWAILAVVLTVVCVSGTLLLYSKAHLSFDRPSIFKRLLPKDLPKPIGTKRAPKRRTIKGSVHSLFTWELYKRLVSDRMLPLIALILVLKCLSGIETATSPLSYSDTIYHEYMTLYSGEWTDAKSDAIATEGAYLDETINNVQFMREAARAGTISDAEYAAYLEALDYAGGRQYYFEQIEAHERYLQAKMQETGVTLSFVYDSGWERIFNAESDLWLYAALFLLLCGSFSGEYRSNASSGGFADIQRTTLGGRKHTFYAKLCSALISSALITLLFSAVDLVLVAVKYDLPELSASIVSIERLSSLPTSLSIGQYLVLYLLTKLGMALLFCLLVFSLSALLKKTLPVMSLALALTLLPNLLVRLGLAFTALDFHSYFAATPFWKAACEGSMEPLVLLVGVVGALILHLIAKRRYG